MRKAPWGRRTALTDWPSQAHVTWAGTDHVVILPKDRRQVRYGRKRRGLGPIQRPRCRPQEIELVEGKAMPDHIPRLLSGPRRSRIALTIGSLKGSRATRIHREGWPTKGTGFGRSCGARGYCVSTVGRDEGQIRRSIREQEKLQRDQANGPSRDLPHTTGSGDGR